MTTPPDATGAHAPRASRIGRLARQVREATALTARTIALVWRSSRAGTAVLGLLTVAVSLSPLAIAVAGKGIVDSVAARSREATLRWVLLEAGIVAAHVLLQRALGLVRELLGARLALDVNVAILEKALTLELAQFEDGRFYDSLTRARRGASHRPLSVVTEGFQLVQNLLTLAGYLALILTYSGLAALALLAAAIPAAVVEVRFSRTAFRLHNWRSPEARKLNYLEWVVANDSHAKEVKLLGVGPFLLGRYRDLGERFHREDRGLAVRRAIWALVLSFLASAAFYGCYVGVALAAAEGAIGLGAMTLYLVAFRQGQQAFQSVLAALGGIYEDTLYMSNLFAYLGASGEGDLAPASGSGAGPAVTVGPAALVPAAALGPAAAPALAALGPAPVALPAAVALPAGVDSAAVPDGSSGGPAAPRVPGDGVRFEGVGFRYPAAPGQEARWALRDVSFHVPPGGSVALVGQNGAGKTTIVKLLTRLYRPTEGRILLDGKDLRDWDGALLRARTAVVFQDFNQYELDLAENVAVGSVAHLADRPRLERALARGGADTVVASLPLGTATLLGKWAHDGVELSGGQWQKLALARAFVREEADLLILDEPTAALDAEAEHAVFERFRVLAEGRTTFLVSHRFSTVRRADRILVLEEGRLLESGSHEELLARRGRYATLFELQARGYA